MKPWHKLNSTKRFITVLMVFAACLAVTWQAGGATAYQKPPKAVLDILRAPDAPSVSVSPAGDQILLTDTDRYPSIADMAQPMARLAGLRINPTTNGPHGTRRITGFSLIKVADGSSRKVDLPASGPILASGGTSWSADGKFIALTHTTANAVELWIIDTAAARMRKIPGITLNAAYGQGVQWMPDQRSLLVQAIPAGRGKAPAPPPVPSGPNIQENIGKEAPVWTYQDLLETPYDEDLFDYLSTSQLGTVDVA
ncbi:MAG: hypothetical protein ABIG68_00940 [Acidobacteriota bacterium]